MAATFDIAEIVDCLQDTNDMTRWLANTETGELAALFEEQTVFDDEDERDLEDDAWVSLPDKYDIDEWCMMRDFARIQRESDAEDLLDAIHGRGAFRLFRSEVERLGLEQDWWSYQDGRYREIAREWLEAHGLAWTDSSAKGGKRQIGRIKAMEEALDEVVAANKALGKALQRYGQAQARARELERYLGSDEWHAAREADEQGLLPADLKRGVLSEDAACDALADNHATAVRMLETATDVVR